MRFAYVRATKIHPEAEQRAALEGEEFDEWYVDEKPSRGEPGRYWLEKLIRACRPGEADEIHVSHPSIIGETTTAALDVLAQITERGAVLVVASTGGRYRWHPEAASAIQLAADMQREFRQATARPGAEAAARRAAARREAIAGKLAEAERLWRDQSVSSTEVFARTGMTRDMLYRRFGPSGRPRFIGVKKDDA